jgi:hypothetical protein
MSVSLEPLRMETGAAVAGSESVDLCGRKCVHAIVVDVNRDRVKTL